MVEGRSGGLVFLLFVGEVFRFDIGYIFSNSIFNNGIQVGVTTQETWLEFFIDSEHILHHEYLPIHIGAGAYPYGWNGETFCNLSCQHGGDFFENESEAATFL